jgi:hypothetical protein
MPVAKQDVKIEMTDKKGKEQIRDEVAEDSI